MQNNLSKVFFKNSKGLKVCGILSNPAGVDPDLVVIISNGFPSTKDSSTYTEIESVINRLGVATLRYDYSGAGESEGTMDEFNIERSVDDLDAAVKFLHKSGYEQIAFVGFSYGGIVSIVYLSRSQEEASFLILVSTVSDYKEQRVMTGKTENDKNWAKEGYVIREDRQGNTYKIPYLFYENLIKIVGSDLATKINCPTLIIHGSADEDIPVEQSKKLAKKMPNATIKIIEGGDHHSSGPVANKRKLDLIGDFVKDFRL